MKYSTINYDFNRPMNKVLTEPLDSDYGIAVRCWKDGEIQDSDISVGGISATTTSDTWQLFDLSTGSTPCTNNYVISIDKAETFSTKIESEQVELKNALPFPMNLTKNIPLSTWIPEGIYNKNWFGLPQVQILSGSTSGDWDDFEDSNDIWVYPQGKSGQVSYYYAHYLKEIGYWYWYNNGSDNPDFEFNNEAFVQLNWHFKTSGQISATFTMDVNSNDGVNGSFNLQVNEADLGYINVEEN